MAPEILPKSMKNRGCVADAFLERFWAARGRQKAQRIITCQTLLGAIFAPKLRKRASKNASKKRCRKSHEK